MSNSHFTFKQFKINQDKCAMKVGTDGCLIGAWANVEKCENVLDIGCGSGLISIMMAQRSNAFVTGIEIDPDAAMQASENVASSPWSNRIKIICCDALHFSSDKKFDAIVSNPPFFSNSLRCSDKERTTARHNDTLTAAGVFAQAEKLLCKNGILSVIIPFDTLQSWCDEAIYKGFGIQRITTVRTLPHKPVKRTLVEFVNGYCASPQKNEMVIEDEPGKYSKETVDLLHEFYLKL